MGRSRKEGDMEGRDIGLIGEKKQTTHSYDHAGWGAVDKMLMGEHPVSHMGTIACASGKMGSSEAGRDSMGMCKGGSMSKGGSMHPHHTREMDTPQKMPKFAAGGVGKVRKGEY